MSELTDSVLAKLSPEEQEAVKKILGEYTQNGQSQTLRDLYDDDFAEIPVSIDEFIESDEYAGWFTNNGKNIFPYWREKLRQIFDDRNNFSEIVLGGCLTGDTLIPLLNGKNVTMKELAEIGDLDEYVYSFDTKRNEYTVGHLIQAFCTGIKKVYKITLDNGKSIKATSNHKFIDSNITWISIDNGLEIGTLLLPSDGCNELSVVSIDYVGEEYVYDLTVEEHHNFVTESGIVAHNSIGCGKSTIAVIGLAYTLYWLMCLRDPNPYFGLGRGDTIFLVFFNATLQLSRGVAYNKFQSILQHSPWFMARGTLSGTKHIEYTPNKTENADIQFTVGSQPEHALGKAIIGGILDEVNFCLHPQTKILTDKGIKTLYELQNQSFKVFYLDDNGNVSLSDEVVSNVTDLVSEMYEIELEDGTVIQCSATHLFMLEDGTYKQAMELTEEDNIKSFSKEELSEWKGEEVIREDKEYKKDRV